MNLRKIWKPRLRTVLCNFFSVFKLCILASQIKLIMLKPRNLFLLLAAVAGMLALIFKFAVEPSAGMPDPSHLAFTFTSIMGVMGTISLIYLVMEKAKRPIPGKVGMVHYVITLVAVVCGVICTSTSIDGVENAAWTRVPSFLSIKLFIISVAFFFYGIVRAVVVRKAV